MAGFWDFRRIGTLGLCLLLWTLLLPVENAQSLHEFQEMSIHGADSDASVARLFEVAQRGHDCHSCLVSHPKTFAGLTLERSVDSPLRVHESNRFWTAQSVPFIQRPHPHKRSPPA